MRTKVFGGLSKVLAIAFICLTMSGCNGDRTLEGTYHHTGGAPITLDFKGNKVTFTIAGESKTLDYKVDGDKVTIIDPDGNVVFTRNADGSLNAPVGTFAKKAS